MRCIMPALRSGPDSSGTRCRAASGSVCILPGPWRRPRANCSLTSRPTISTSSHQLEILSLVAKLPVTSIIALHDLNLAAMFCDSLAILHHGKVVAAGTPEEVLTEDLIARVFGVRAYIERSAHHGRQHVQYRLD